MLFRFCLYGFLKNQQYYDPFIILALREKGLSFFVIGILIAFQHVCSNLLQVPSGIIADLWGRKRSMILSFTAYIFSFLLYGLSKNLVVLFAAALLFAVGDSFRSGTHKAMIFTWLQHMGREKEKTRFYGLTRSWSQLGSALSVVIAALIVFSFQRYSLIFWISAIPYVFGIINILGYPAFLDGAKKGNLSLASASRELLHAFATSWRNIPLRNLFTESMVFRGTFSVTKRYLQPLLKATALSLPLMVAFTTDQRAALLVGGVYFILYLLSSFASRHAHRICSLVGGENRASGILWVVMFAGFAVMTPSLLSGNGYVAILCFLVIAVLQNIFRPVLMSRLDEASDADLGATILSIDSQLESIFIMITAPLIGLAVDNAGLWPVGVFGALAAGAMLIFMHRNRVPSSAV